MDRNATGRFIAECRKRKGYTQKELAEKLMVTDKAVSRWETGKGLPDTSLLKPLGDALGVSVTELLSGETLQEEEMKDQTDRILLESLDYPKRMLGRATRVVLFIIGIALAISPLFTAGPNHLWVLGAAITAAAVLCVSTRRKEAKNRARYIAAMISQCAALILEILPVGAVLVFAAGPDERVTEVYSYFSLLPMGYANVTPMLTGLLTAVVLLLGVIAVLRFEKAPKLREAVFICSVIAFLLSLVPLVLFGAAGMTEASYGVSGAILLSVCLQGAAGRRG